MWKKLLIVGMVLIFGSGAVYGGKPFAEQGGALPENDVWNTHANKLLHSGAKLIRYPDKPLPPLTAEDRERGYVLFRQHYSEVVFDSDRPQAYQLMTEPEQTIFSSRGEYEPVTVNLFTLREWPELSLSVSDLKMPGGVFIPAENVDVRVVRRMPGLINVGRSMSEFINRSIALERLDRIDAAANEIVQFWVTVYVPPAASPSIPVGTDIGEFDNLERFRDRAYRGTATLRSGETTIGEITLNVVVLPFKARETDRLYGMCYLPLPGELGFHPENLEKHMVDMRNHGMNSIWTWPDVAAKEVDGEYVFDFTRAAQSRERYFSEVSLSEVVDAYMKAGFTRFWVNGSLEPINEVCVRQLGLAHGTPEWEKAYLSYIRQVRQYALEHGWPDYCHQCIDEPGDIEKTIYLYGLLSSNLPDEKKYLDGGPHGEGFRLIEHVDIFNAAIPSPEGIAAIRDAGKHFWIYNSSYCGLDPKVDRAIFGFGAEKIGAEGVFQWSYQWWDTATVWVYTLPSPAGPIPTAAWEGVREGIKDAKYVDTLKSILSGLPSDHPAHAEFAAQMAAIHAVMPGGENPIMGGNYRPGLMAHLDGIKFDEFRWNIARQIVKLLKQNRVLTDI